MADPLTIGLVGGWVLGGVIGNATDRAACIATRKVQDMFLSGLTEPRNHDLTRAIRRSQLLALKLVIKAYEVLPHEHWRDNPGYSVEDISAPLAGWVQRTIARDKDTDVNLKHLTGLDKNLWEKRRNDVEAKIESVFTHPEPNEGEALSRQAALRELAEDWMLDEIGLIVVRGVDWPRFECLFRARTPNNNFPGWWLLFRAFLAEEIKGNEAVQRILAQQGIAKILNIQNDIHNLIESLQTNLEASMMRVRSEYHELREAISSISYSSERIEQSLFRIDAAFSQIAPALLGVNFALRDIPNKIADDANKRFDEWFGVVRDVGSINSDHATSEISDFPTRALIARYRVVPYVDFGDTLSNLKGWVAGSNRRKVSGRLLVSAGGTGKTRLAIELVNKLTPDWFATFVTEANTKTANVNSFRQLLACEKFKGFLFIVDHAETQTHRLKLICDAVVDSRKAVRILALTRSTEGWWRGFSQEHSVMSIFDPNPCYDLVGKLTSVQAEGLFYQSRKAFSVAIANIENESAVPYSEINHVNGLSISPMDVLIQAFLACSNVNIDNSDLLDLIYWEEKAHWKRVISSTGEAITTDSDSRVKILERLVAQITLVQGATKAGGFNLASADAQTYADHGFDKYQPVNWAEMIYGDKRLISDGTGCRMYSYLRPVQPGLIGEHMIASTLNDGGIILASNTFKAALKGSGLFADSPAMILWILSRICDGPHSDDIRAAAREAIIVINEIISDVSYSEATLLESVIPHPMQMTNFSDQRLLVRDL